MAKLLALVAVVVAAGTAGYFLASRGADEAVSLGPSPQQRKTSTQGTQAAATLPRANCLNYMVLLR